jgi:hypothetical protein
MSQRPGSASLSAHSPNSYTMNLGAARSTLACKVKSLALRRSKVHTSNLKLSTPMGTFRKRKTESRFSIPLNPEGTHNRG